MLQEFKAPSSISAVGKSAHSVILKVLNKYEAESGGCKTFYSPKEWADRRESYGTKSHLIVVYDGGDVGNFFNMNHGSYKLYEEMQEALAKVGLYFEECTGWYAAIYSI